MKTREKILQKTISLFNEHGFANVTLQHIASELKISLGNLTYHFPKKDDLVNAIYKILKKGLQDRTNPYKVNPSFQVLDSQVRVFYEFQQQFKFFYLDTLDIERAYPIIKREHQTHIELQIEIMYEGLYYNIGQGNLRSDIDLDVYKSVAHKTWFILALWSTQNAIRGKENDTADEMIKAIWELIIPYFTDKGLGEYQYIYQPTSTENEEPS